MNLDHCAPSVYPGLRISGMPGHDWPLDAWGFGLVVSLSDHLPPHAARRFEWGTRGGAAGAGQILYLHWPFEDGPVPDLARASVVVDTVIAAVRAGLPVLVHCQEGRNRSGLIAALAIRDLAGCDGATAMRRVRDARPGMLANRAFAGMLSQLPAPA